eukprot:471337-Amphidinium_carterae.1
MWQRAAVKLYASDMKENPGSDLSDTYWPYAQDHTEEIEEYINETTNSSRLWTKKKCGPDSSDNSDVYIPFGGMTLPSPETPSSKEPAEQHERGFVPQEDDMQLTTHYEDEEDMQLETVGSSSEDGRRLWWSRCRYVSRRRRTVTCTKWTPSSMLALE